MNDQTTEIKSKIDIVEYIGQFVGLKRAGRNFKGLCPFHQEKTPSFVVSPDRQIWHCFGTCGVGGDVISFLMKLDNLTFFEALKELADKTGVVLENASYQDTAWNQKEKLYTINALALKYYQYLLEHTAFGETAMKYLHDRGLNDKIIKTFELGYAPSSWDSLIKYLKKKNYSLAQIEEAGLAIRKSEDAGYDRFRNRIIFPLRDARENIVGFSGRSLKSDAKSAKYVNTPETDVYHKRNHLYGIHKTKEAIRKHDNAIVVEGEFDLIMPYQCGVENIVAIKGAALTEGQLNILKRYTKRLSLALDTDEAGEEAMKRGIALAEKMDFELHIVEFTRGKDPDEAVRIDKPGFLQDVKKAKPIYDFLIESAKKKFPKDVSSDKKKIGNEVAPFIRQIQNPIVKSHYVRVLARTLDVPDESVDKLLRTHALSAEVRTHHKKQKESASSRPEMMQKYILSFLLQHNDPGAILRQAPECFTQELFPFPAYASLFSHLEPYQDPNSPAYQYTEFVKKLSPQALSVADELYLYASEFPITDIKYVIKLSFELRILLLKQDLAREAAHETDDAKLSTLSQKLKHMEKTYRTL